jgi:hypothetical protein
MTISILTINRVVDNKHTRVVDVWTTRDAYREGQILVHVGDPHADGESSCVTMTAPQAREVALLLAQRADIALGRQE